MRQFSTYLPLASSSHSRLTRFFKDFSELVSKDWDFYSRGVFCGLPIAATVLAYEQSIQLGWIC
jgi:hypothetical protein